MVGVMNPEAYLEMAETEAHHWWFAGRRSVTAYLISKFNLPAEAKILEIGSGTGGNLQMLSAFGQVSALEMDASARSISAEKTGGGVDIRAGRCPMDIPFSGEKFNLICLFDVLEHIEEDVATLIAIKKLLADGGRVLITVPAYRWLWSAHDEFLHHRRRYSARELQEKIAVAGMVIEKMSYFNILLFPLAVAARLKDRLFRSLSASGTKIPHPLINGFFRELFSIERFLLGSLNFPFGVSLLAILRAE